jgi:hypothetical protein
LVSPTLREDHRLRVSENRVLRKIFEHKRKKWKEAGENYIMRSFTICTLHRIRVEPG